MTNPLAQRELIDSLAETSGAIKKDVTSMIKALSDVIQWVTAKRNAATIPIARTIQSKDRLARMVHNPAAGEQFPEFADRKVKATALKAIKDAAVSVAT